MNCEIEFHAVGKASRGGDAIIIRTGAANSYRVTIIDGGDLESGKAVVQHIRNLFGAKCIISEIVVTHPDSDHVSGVREILAELDVRSLWIHLPWNSAQASLQYFSDKRWTVSGLQKYLQEQYDLTWELFRLAQERSIPIFEPFAGQKIGPFTVLSPSRQAYQLLMPQFDRSPDADQAAIQAIGLWIGKSPGLFQKFAETITAKVQKWTTEKWDVELLREGGITSASNESSVVLYGDFAMGRVLLTADAGNWALSLAAHFAEQNGLVLRDFTFIQIPHHGSRRNVSPSVLDRIAGPILRPDRPDRFLAFCSAPKDNDQHPRKMVLNAFVRRGGKVHATQGTNQIAYGGFPARNGYTATLGMPFSANVEEYD